MKSVLFRYRAAWSHLVDLGDAVPSDSWDHLSPCPSWTARHLVGHLLDGLRQVQAMTQDRTPPAAERDPGALAALGGTSPGEALHAALATVETVVDDLDTADAVSTPRGRRPVSQFASMALIEPVIHGWDLARATGQSIVLDPVAVRILLDGLGESGAQLAATGMYAPALPTRPDTPDTERLLAIVGRAV